MIISNPEVDLAAPVHAMEESSTKPKPKQKYVMTPEHRAKVIANLGKARLAPKEIVYRKTEKRHAANLKNLGIASAKRRQQQEALHASLQELFPPLETPPPAPEPSPRLDSQRAPLPAVSGEENVERATRLIAKRLRKVQAAHRREGRRIMRLLTAAMHRSQPLTAEEAVALVAQLMRCLETARLTVEVRRLNRKIERLLFKMIETRYGVEPGSVPVEHWLEQLREDRRALAAELRARREARQAERERVVQGEGRREGTGPGSGDEGRAVASGGEGGGAEASREQPPEPGKAAVPELPRTYEEFESFLARALSLEDEPKVAGALAMNLWIRLHAWKHQEATERQGLDRLFQEGQARLPESFKELNQRVFTITGVLKLDKSFLQWLDQRTRAAQQALDYWALIVPSLLRQRGAETVEFPAKPPVGAGSGEVEEAPKHRSAVA